jgi:transcriptional regulator with XRE-family HTH domain
VQETASTRFKKRLRELRRGKNWSQEQAAESCGIGQKMFQLYELGVKDNPSLKQIEKISHGFGLDVSELLAPNFPKVRLPKSLTRKPKT